MAKFLMTENVIGARPDVTARLGAGVGAANWHSDAEVGKFVKFVAESRYDLCAAGDPIEGFITSMENAKLDDFSLGSVRSHSRKEVTFDGLQATAGTGTVAIGDYVVCGTIVAKGTKLTGPPKVTKATSQAAAPFMWRVISLGAGGVGTVGGVGIIERVNG